MKTFFATLLTLLLLGSGYLKSQDTFSICAVDPVTGQVGSAGASCVNDCTILTDVHPGYGVVHTQASWLAANQNYARSLMNLRLTPQAIIDSLVLHDAQGNATIRQYGIVDLTSGGRVAAYTGPNCSNYKNHIIGPTYSIQGNILLGQQILDSMESRFLNTPGNLAAKLMAALQGAKVIGADTRCASWNTSSKSAFLRVANPGDTLGTLSLNIKVLSTPFGRDPIDSLQVLYNNAITTLHNTASSVPHQFELLQNYPNPFNPVSQIGFRISDLSASNNSGSENSGSDRGFVTLKVYDVLGNEVASLVNEKLGPGQYEVEFDGGSLSSGIYLYRLEVNGNAVDAKRMILLR
ncbi:MAG: DUF1028 domain-containing protein [bacterium]